jgi:hypothetical protein
MNKNKDDGQSNETLNILNKTKSSISVKKNKYKIGDNDSDAESQNTTDIRDI